jgi:hypothetical protein
VPATLRLLLLLAALLSDLVADPTWAGEVEPTPTATETETATPEATGSATETVTAEPEATATDTATTTPTETVSDTPTETPTETATGTPTPTSTPTPLPTEPLPRTCADPTNPEAIGCGEIVSCNLPFIGATKSFTFDAVLGDAVCIQTAALAGSPIEPRTQLLGPDFGQLPGCSTQRGGLACCVLRDTGRHRIVVQDAGGDEVGSYTVSLHGVSTKNRAQALSCGPPLSCGGVVNATLRRPGDLDGYRFTAVAGDGLYVNTAPLGGSDADPRWQLFQPNGSPVSGCTSAFGGMDSCSALPETGTYTLIVSDAGANESGSYALSVQVISESNCCGESLEAGGSSMGVIARVGQTDSYSFSADAGQGVVVTTTAELGSPVQPAWRVYAPDGSPVGGCFTGFGGQKSCGSLPLRGTYTVVVMDAGSSRTGAYSLALQGDAGPGACSIVPSCIGDCDRSGSVSLDELVISVNIALGRATVDLCDDIDRSRDRMVAVDELVESVRNSMAGCP